MSSLFCILSALRAETTCTLLFVGCHLSDSWLMLNAAGIAEGTGIDLDQNSTTALPAAVRPPSALLALESSYSATGGDNDARNYRVCGSTRLDVAKYALTSMCWSVTFFTYDSDIDIPCSLVA